ncbi:Shedu anti-phage system protein SduA domain-containing protein [Methylobacterium sp. HMF5984]|uniref:Shedu anti-phage system protein SduA domain-containing protein n=1 Tax=Methylobacterium sp. HMF5984 TaxID=3367370 RepID=UPI003853AE19
MRSPSEIQVHVPNRLTKPGAPTAKSIALKSGPRVFKTATLFDIPDTKRGGVHHDNLKIETQIRENGGWGPPVDGRSISLEREEIDRLTDFLGARRDGVIPSDRGRYLMLPAGAKAEFLLEQVGALETPDKTDALALLLRHASEKPQMLRDLIERLSTDGDYLEKTVASINLAVYERVVKKLEYLIDTSTREQDFQSLLEEHPWLFGSGYSELLPRRCFVRDQQKDFVTRRTTDGRIEVIEIKTPMNGKSLFAYDADHKNLFPSSALSRVTAQVENYLDSLDGNRNAIKVTDNIDTAKVCAKIIIGRDGDDAQRSSLVRHNGHLNRIEIITFDGLLAIAKRVLRYLQDPVSHDRRGNPPKSQALELDDDIPF